MPLARGHVLQDRYRIVKLIGQGGFGAVYRAWDITLNQPIALKVNLDSSHEAERQFKREAILLAGLRHPNLPRVIDHFFVAAQGQYLVMDYVEGVSLGDMLLERGRPFTESEVIPWIEQVCDALNYLHSLNPPIIHRDIKPQNIIVSPEGRAMLVDFGISKTYNALRSTTIGARAVTPGYSPPEQYGTGSTDPRTDIYALGATLYEVLTGEVPPESLNVLTHISTLLPPRQINPHISRNVSAAILKAMSMSTSERYATVLEFSLALRFQPSVDLQPKRPASSIESFGDGELEIETPVGLHSFRLKPCTTLDRAVKNVLEKKRLNLIHNISNQLNKAAGEIITLIGFPNVGTSYITREIAIQLNKRSSNIDIVVRVDFSHQDADKKLRTLLREMRKSSGILKRRLRKAIKEVYDIYVLEEDDYDKDNSRSSFRGRPGKSGIKVGLPFEFSFSGLGLTFLVNKPVEVERWAEESPSSASQPSPESAKKQRDLARILRDLVDLLQTENAKVCFIFDKITDKSALNVLLPVLKRDGISSLVVMSADRFYSWQRHDHPLTNQEPRYVPCVWSASKEIVEELLGEVPEEFQPTVAYFERFIDFRGHGCPGDIRVALEKFYTRPQRPPRWIFPWSNTGLFEIREEDLSEIGTYGRILSLLDEDMPRIIPAVDGYRYDLARRQMYEKLTWMVQKTENNQTFNPNDLTTKARKITVHAPENFDALDQQVSQNLVNTLQEVECLVEKDGELTGKGMIHFNVTTSIPSPKMA